MKLHTESVVTHPIDKVWETMRDRLPELVPFLSGAESIEVAEREDLGPGKVRMLNHWQGNKSVAPKAVRPFLTKGLLRWKDHAVWEDSTHTVEWKFETFHFDKLFDCSGHNLFEITDDGHTKITISGNLDIYPERMPGVPKFLARKLKPKIESFISNLVGSNLADLANGLQKFLDQ